MKYESRILYIIIIIVVAWAGHFMGQLDRIVSWREAQNCGEIIFDTVYAERTPAIPMDCIGENGC